MTRDLEIFFYCPVILWWVGGGGGGITAISKPHWLSLYFRLVCNTSLAVSQEALNFHAFSRSAVVVDLKVSCRAFNVSSFFSQVWQLSVNYQYVC